MNQNSKKIRKTRGKKTSLDQSKVVYCLIFSYLSQKDRLTCRLVSRSFNNYGILSIESLNFEAQNTKMKAFKPFIMKCANLKYLSYPCLYKKVQMTSLVGKKNRPQIREITHLNFRTYDEIADLMKLNTGLRALELNLSFDDPPNTEISNDIVQILLNSQIEEIIIKKQTIQDLKLIRLLSQKIISLKIIILEDSNIVLNLLIALELKLKKLYIKIVGHDNVVAESLRVFLNSQTDLEILYLDYFKGVNLENHTKLKTIILENVNQLKDSFVFPKAIVKKIIIKSLYLTKKEIKFLLSKFEYFDLLDLSSIQGCWFDILLAKNKIPNIQETQYEKRLNVYLSKQSLVQLRNKLPKNIKIYQLEDIQNLFNYFQ